MNNIDALNYPYASRRNAVFGKNGMVATSQPLAAQAGLNVLQKGGNAIDAAVATAAALSVVEPTANGIGGDCFALIWSKNKLHGLNASGPAPMSLSLEKIQSLGIEQMPKWGPLPVTVPGTPAAWAAMTERFGSMSLSENLSQAIQLAEEGFPVSPSIAYSWGQQYQEFKKNLTQTHFSHWFSTFAHNGAPQPGELVRLLDHAKTLQSIAQTGANSFYRGELAQKIASFMSSIGGFIQESDLDAFQVDWCDPISINYRGYDVWEIPPNGHGMVALMALNILKGFEFTDRDNLHTYHHQIEAMKLAYSDGFAHIAEPSSMKVRVQDLLSDDYASIRRKLIGTNARIPLSGIPPKGGTVYLCTADKFGNMVSMIQSNYMGFGSGLVVPGTGISLHNRGNNFSLTPGHPNAIAPGKRPYHTIIPGFLTKAGKAVGPFGVMGGFMQPQGHVQMVMNTVDFRLNPQASLDAPRWEWKEGNKVALERSTGEHLFYGLDGLGHEVAWNTNRVALGRGQIIWRNDEGVLCGGTEPRTDGAIATW